MKRERKKRGYSYRLVIAAILALVLGGIGLGFGLGTGSGTQNQQPDESTLPSAAPSPIQSGKYVITILEKDILYQGKKVTPDELREMLLSDFSGKETYELRDEHAIKAVYDAAKEVLVQLYIPFVEK